jgi:hypothetical protein
MGYVNKGDRLANTYWFNLSRGHGSGQGNYFFTCLI